jgi:hypothetical protein
MRALSLRQHDDDDRQKGQTLVLIAIVLPVLLGMGALALDVAHLFVEKRHTQNAVDAAALAAASQLPAYPVSCSGPYTTSGTCQYNVSQTVQQYSVYNGGPNVPFAPCVSASDTNCFVTTDGTPTAPARVQVRLQESTPTWFIGALGFGGPANVSSSAGAYAGPQTQVNVIPGTPGTVTTLANDAAMFAMNPVCGANNGIVVGPSGGQGNNAVVNGASISNGSVNINGNPSTHMTWVSYRKTSAADCTAGAGVPSKIDTVTTHTNTFTTTPAPGDWPKWFDDAAICNNYVSSVAMHVTVVTGNYTLPSNPSPGIYCNQSGSISLPNTNANVTLVANTVTINGNNDVISAYSQGLLAMMTGTGTLNVNANGSTGASLTGYLFAPNGDIAYNGNSGANGFYEAQNVRILGNNFTITGNGPGGTPGTTVTTSPATTTTVTIGSTQNLDQ